MGTGLRPPVRVMTEGTPTAEIARPRRQIIERPRLTRLLDASTARIITLVAPAGYGKTTLARQWVEIRASPVAWLSARTGMMDASSYATDLAQVLEPTSPGVAAAMHAMRFARWSWASGIRSN